MSEARKKLKAKERKGLQNELEKEKFTGAGSKWTPEEEEKRLAEIKRLEERNNEMLKRKKEELKMKHEELYRIIKSGIRDALRDEKGAAEKYRVLANLCRRAGNETIARILENIANDEERHFKDLNIHTLS